MLWLVVLRPEMLRFGVKSFFFVFCLFLGVAVGRITREVIGKFSDSYQ